MNNYKHFGELLEQLRISNNMTQTEVAEGICTLRQYSRLEKGESNPRIDVLYGLSNKFNTNLYEFYNIHFCHQSFEAFKCIKDMNQTIYEGNLSNLESVIQSMQNLKEFNTGDNFKNLCYAQALFKYSKSDFVASLNFCLKGLQVPNFESLQKFSSHKIYSNIDLCLINCLGCDYGELSKTEEAIITFVTLVSAIDNQAEKLPFSSIKNSNFVQNSYENAILNLSNCYFQKQDLHSASKICSKRN